jgi:dihydroflavonol-4-reductase
MLVTVTGGTGYVGSHIVAALREQGHKVRLFVRRPQQVPRSLGPLGVTVDDLVVGDVLDEVAVGHALDDADAVVHAAAVFSLDPRRAAEVLRTNERATELVLGGAVKRGLDPVVHISSTVALTRFGGSGPDLPLGDVDMPYAWSKNASEQIARRLQDAGAPVVSIYPGGVLGPHDPYCGTNAEVLHWVLSRRVPVWPRGGVHYVDVRDVAAVVAAVLEGGRGPRRYVVPGHHMDGDLLFGTIAKLTGRRLPRVQPPARVVLRGARLVERLNRVLPERWHIPADAEAAELAVRDTRFDTTATTRDLGVAARPFEETLRDTILWLVDFGVLKPKYAGRLLNRGR